MRRDVIDTQPTENLPLKCFFVHLLWGEIEELGGRLFLRHTPSPFQNNASAPARQESAKPGQMESTGRKRLALHLQENQAGKRQATRLFLLSLCSVALLILDQIKPA
jgi:hypothetical protein